MSLTDREFEYVRTVLKDLSGIVLEAGKGYLVDARLTPVARSNGYDSVPALVRALQSTPLGPLHEKVIDALTTNETSFFRDVDVYKTLQTQILPELLTKAGRLAHLAIWSAAASTGQEAYTLAMTLKEHFPAEFLKPSRILATDLSPTVLERAREGKYTTLEVNRGLPASLLVKYFVQNGLCWDLKDEIKRKVDFREMNLTKPWPSIPPMDLIMLRNVLIYFDVPTKKEILRKMRGALRPHGYLMLGTAETTLNIDPDWEPVKFGKVTAYRAKPPGATTSTTTTSTTSPLRRTP